jgi:hypothetical protein
LTPEEDMENEKMLKLIVLPDKERLIAASPTQKEPTSLMK